jgi:FkbM family methyltransferase
MATDTSPAAEEAAAGSATALKECRHGRMLYLRRDVYIGRSLEMYGEFSEREAQMLSQALGPGATVVEVGANIGTHTVQLAKLVGPQGTVLAFEPQRIIFSLLCANLMLNEQFHVQPIRAAVGDTHGSMPVPVLDPHAAQNFGGVSLGPSGAGDTVPLVMLDDYTLPSLRLLKIDVEGMEIRVLKGARRTIAAHRPLLYVENDRPQNSAALIGLILALGYRLFWHLPPLFNPDNFAGNPENVFPGILSVNMIGVPAEKPSVITGLRDVTGPNDWWQGPAPS